MKGRYEMKNEKIKELYTNTNELPKGIIIKVGDTIYKGKG